MKKTSVFSSVLFGLLAGSVLIGAAVVRAESAASLPPQNLKLVGDHWTPWDPPQVGPDAYSIVKGDTLWHLAERWLGDPYLWPQVWDENRYILDSHWIYPGDPLVIPGRPTVVPEEGPPPVAEASPPVAETPPDTSGGYGRTAEGRPTVHPRGEAPPVVKPPRLLRPVADATDLYCSGWIESEHRISETRVGGASSEKIAQGQGDVIYLDRGRDSGVQAGQVFAVVRPVRAIKHPSSGEPLGTYMSRLGRVRVLLSQASRSTAVIEMSCSTISEGDELVPWTDIPFPLVRSIPEFNRWDAEPSGGATGQVIDVSEDLNVVAQGHVVQTDLGADSGLRPGDVLTMFRHNGDQPRTNLGQAIVLMVEPRTSTVKITRSVKEAFIGDWVEVAPGS